MPRQTADGFIARPLIPLTAAFIAGIAVVDRFPGLGPWAAAGVAAAAGVLLLHRLRRAASVVWPLLLFAALGGLSIRPWHQEALPAGHVLLRAGDARCRIEGTVASRPQAAPGRLRLVLAVDALERPTGRVAACGKVRLTIAGTAPRLGVGERIAISSRVRPVRSFRNPGGFDYRRYLRFKDIRATCWTRGREVEKLTAAPPADPAAGIDGLRTRIGERIDAEVDPRTRGVLKALIVGDRDGVSDALRDAFNRAGVGHLLAISGLHVGMVAAAAFFGLLRVLSFFPALLRRAWTRKTTALCTLLPVVAYGLIAGMAPATRRAVIMAVVFLLAMVAENEHDPLNTLALAALLILAWHPPALFSIGFQLSFAAAGSILYGLDRLSEGPNRRRETVGRKLPAAVGKKIWGLVLVSTLAVGGTLPLVMGCFNQVSLVGLPVNVLLVPMVGFVVVPLGLTAALALFLSPALGGVLLAAAGKVLLPVTTLAQWAAQLPGAAVKTITPSGIEIAAYYLAAWGLLNLVVKPPAAAGPASSSAPWRLRPAGIMALSLAAAVLAGDAAWWARQRFASRELRLTVLDVGHGSASLLEFPGGRVMLVDGGGFPDNRTFDVGQRVVAPYLWRRKILTVDTVVLSHPNSDHLNGLHFICRHFNVQQVWTNGQPARTRSYRQFQKLLADAGIHSPAFTRLRRRQRIGAVAVDILHPPVSFLNRLGSRPWRDANDNSLVLRLSYGDVSFLLPGDVMGAAERRLTARHAEGLASTVLLAPHHGSRSSSSAGFLKRVRPKLVVVSAGSGGRFHFPHPQVVHRYLRRGVRVYRTDRHGAVSLICGHGGLQVVPTCGQGWVLPVEFCRKGRNTI